MHIIFPILDDLVDDLISLHLNDGREIQLRTGDPEQIFMTGDVLASVVSPTWTKESDNAKDMVISCDDPLVFTAAMAGTPDFLTLLLQDLPLLQGLTWKCSPGGLITNVATGSGGGLDTIGDENTVFGGPHGMRRFVLLGDGAPPGGLEFGRAYNAAFNSGTGRITVLDLDGTPIEPTTAGTGFMYAAPEGTEVIVPPMTPGAVVVIPQLTIKFPTIKIPV
jgi:hypothetical protein